MSTTVQSLQPLSFSLARPEADRGPRPRLTIRFGRTDPAPGPGRPAAIPEFRFRSFRLLPRSRTLLRGAEPVDCGSRAFDLLHVLLLSRGKVVPKEEIVRHVWPTTIVDESNLRFQMAALRRVLGPDKDLIKTIPGRGYLFATEYSGA
jgi:DNA-binding response OmpR family regulator